jgi:hypothetical protein
MVDKYGLRTEPLAKTKDAAGQAGVLGDVESHLSPGHQYRDANKGTWAHEGSHGVSSRIRNLYGGWDVCNGCYILQDTAVVIPEPRIDLGKIAARIPSQLRTGQLSSFYNLYLVQSLRDWRHNTLYLWDEFNAYTTGTWAGIENKISHASSTLNMCVMGLYCMYALQAMAVAGKDIQQARAYLQWNWAGRVVGLIRMAEGTRMHNPAVAPLGKWASSSREYRKMATDLMGPCWVTAVHGEE